MCSDCEEALDKIEKVSQPEMLNGSKYEILEANFLALIRNYCLTQQFKHMFLVIIRTYH